jgi:dTMP kinase
VYNFAVNPSANERPGKFIVIEGLDGSGITEQAELLRDWLRHKYYALNRIAFTHEPSAGPIGQLLNLTMEGRLNLDEEAIALLFAADRNDHLTSFIRPRLNAGLHVLSERYYLSFYAYQAGQGLSMEWLRLLGKKWITPDIVIVLDTPLEQCMNNIRQRFQQTRYENMETLRKTWEEFRRLIAALKREGESIHVVDGSGGGDSVHQRIIPILHNIFTEK